MSRDTSRDAAAGRSAGLVAAGILVSRLMGFVRSAFQAQYLGTSAENDVYNMALRIPNALRNLFGEGTLSAAFIPVYSRMLGAGDARGARALANALLGVLLIAVSVLTLVGIAAAPWLTAVFAYGFDPAKRELTTRLVRVMFPMAGLMVLSGWCLGIQNSHRRFFVSYASAAMWSVAQIILLAIGGPRAESLSQLAWWLAWATLAGAVLQVLAQVPEVWRLAGPIRPVFSLQSEGVRTTLRNIVPVVGALGVVQLSGFADGLIASFLADGALSVLSYANMLFVLPVALFGISVSASSLPALASDRGALGADAATSALLERVRAGWVRVLFYVIPSAVVFVLFGDLLVGLVFRSGRGQFGLSDQRLVHGALAAYALGLASFSSNRLFAAVFHSMQDYRTPLRFAAISVTVTIASAAALSLPWSADPRAVAGIALGSALGSWVNFLLLSGRLRTVLGPLTTAIERRTITRIAVVTAGAALLGVGARVLLEGSHQWVQGPLVLVAFSLAYLVVSWRLGSAEAARWLRLRPRRTE
jgi:putative peptidoglycan lipid II flippase